METVSTSTVELPSQLTVLPENAPELIKITSSMKTTPTLCGTSETSTVGYTINNPICVGESTNMMQCNMNKHANFDSTYPQTRNSLNSANVVSMPKSLRSRSQISNNQSSYSPYKCLRCGEPCNTRAQLDRHVEAVHKHQCSFCHETFETGLEYKYHEAGCKAKKLRKPSSPYKMKVKPSLKHTRLTHEKSHMWEKKTTPHGVTFVFKEAASPKTPDKSSHVEKLLQNKSDSPSVPNLSNEYTRSNFTMPIGATAQQDVASIEGSVVFAGNKENLESSIVNEYYQNNNALSDNEGVIIDSSKVISITAVDDNRHVDENKTKSTANHVANLHDNSKSVATLTLDLGDNAQPNCPSIVLDLNDPRTVPQLDAVLPPHTPRTNNRQRRTRLRIDDDAMLKVLDQDACNEVRQDMITLIRKHLKLEILTAADLRRLADECDPLFEDEESKCSIFGGTASKALLGETLSGEKSQFMTKTSRSTKVKYPAVKHEPNQLYRCMHCKLLHPGGKSFTLYPKHSSAVSHMTSHLPFHCTFCAKSYSAIESLGLIDSKDDDGYVQVGALCEKCEEVCDVGHDSGVKLSTYKCMHCEERYTEYHELILHMSEHLPFICTPCNMSYSSTLEIHDMHEYEREGGSVVGALCNNCQEVMECYDASAESVLAKLVESCGDEMASQLTAQRGPLQTGQNASKRGGNTVMAGGTPIKPEDGEENTIENGNETPVYKPMCNWSSDLIGTILEEEPESGSIGQSTTQSGNSMEMVSTSHIKEGKHQQHESMFTVDLTMGDLGSSEIKNLNVIKEEPQHAHAKLKPVHTFAAMRDAARHARQLHQKKLEATIIDAKKRKLEQDILVESLMEVITPDTSSQYEELLRNEPNKLTKQENMENDGEVCLYKCVRCIKKYPSRYQLVEHIAEHSLPFECFHCGNLSGTIDAIIHHNREAHPYLRCDGECRSCRVVFTNEAEIKMHRTDHPKNDEPHKCWICLMTFSSEVALVEHIHGIRIKKDRENKSIIENHAQELPTTFICPMCFKGESAIAALSAHLQDEHRMDPNLVYEGENDFHKCTHCSKAYSKRVLLMNHMSFHSSPFICNESPSCKRRYRTKEDLDRHVDMQHVQKALKGKCNVCPFKAFDPNDQAEMFEHQTVHHPRSRIQCCVCDTCFETVGSLRSHVYDIHASNDEKRFQCSECKARFVTASRLCSHIQLHIKANERATIKKNENKAIPSYICRNCETLFKNYTYLKIHEKYCQFIRTTISNTTRYSCIICTKVFSSKFEQIKHNHAHSNVSKMYPCHLCSQRFASHYKLRCHINSVHTGKRQFKCTKCNRSFFLRKQLHIHKCTRQKLTNIVTV